MQKNEAHPHDQETQQGFPIQLKLLVTVIALGVIVMVLKVSGII